MVYKKIRTGKSKLPLQSLTTQDMNKIKQENTVATILDIIILILFILVFLMWAEIVKEILQNRHLWNSNKHYERAKYKSDVVSCYYNIPSPTNTSQLTPSNIHPNLCTHINIAFAQIRNKEIFLDDSQIEVLPDIVDLKKLNPKLKVLLSVGGAGSDNGFSEMVVNHASRKIFIKSIINMLHNYSLDGIDLDWEFPAVSGFRNRLRKREKQHFSQLLREIKTEYMREKKDFLLTVALAAPQIIVDAAYDVDQINMYVDFANIMTYDFHTYTKYTPMTGFNAPLYARPNEHLYLATLNVDYTVQMYIKKGLDPSKIVVGIPTYGHSFTLVNANNAKVGSPASGFGTLGNLGFVNYPDICVFVRESHDDVIINEDIEALVPYLHVKSEWVSFDNAKSVAAKAMYIRNRKLRGAMIYSLNADDYEGRCEKVFGNIQFPLATAVKNTLKKK